MKKTRHGRALGAAALLDLIGGPPHKAFGRLGRGKKNASTVFGRGVGCHSLADEWEFG
jgi:hypothetical protein